MSIKIKPQYIKRVLKTDDLGSKYIEYSITIKSRIIVQHIDEQTSEKFLEEKVYPLSDKKANTVMTKELLEIQEEPKPRMPFDMPEGFEDVFSGFNTRKK